MPFQEIRTDVSFVVNTPVVKANLAQVREAYAATTGAMSDDAIKMSLAQERLQRSIERTGVSSAATQRAALNYRSTTAAVAAANAPAAAPSVGEQLNKIQPAARMAGRAITTYVTAPVAILGYEAIKMASSFQSSMELVHTQAGASQKAVDLFSKSLLAMAGPLGTAPETLSQGLFHLASQGLRGAKAISALKVAAEGAKVGQANLEDVTNALGAAIVSGIKGTQSYQEAMGVLNATVGAGDMHMQDLADAMGTGLPASAALAGVSLKDVGAALAVLGDNNIRGAKAGTDMISMLRLMSAPSKAAAKALATVGLGTTTLADDLRHGGIPAALQDLVAHMKAAGLNADQQGVLLTRAFGGRQSTGIKVLVDQMQRLQTKEKDVGDGASGFAKSWQATTKTTAFQFAQMRASLDADMIKIGHSITPVAAGVAGAVTSIVDELDKLPHFAKEDIGIIVGLLAVGGPLIVATAAVIRAVNTIGAAFGLMQKRATVSIAATDGELTTLGTTAETTAAKIDALAGSEGAAGGIAGIGFAASGARTEVNLLRASLLGLSGLGGIGLATAAGIVAQQGAAAAGLDKGLNTGIHFGSGNDRGSVFFSDGRYKVDYVDTGSKSRPGGGRTGTFDISQAEADRLTGRTLPSPAQIMHPDHRLRRAGSIPSGPVLSGTAGGNTGGDGGAKSAPAPTYKPSRLALLRRQLAKSPNSVDAIKAMLAYDQEAIAFANKEIGSGKLSPKRGAQVEQELEQLYGDENQLLGELQQIAQQAAEKEKQRQERIEKSREAVLKQRLAKINKPVIALQSEIANAQAHNASQQRLLQLYRKERKALDLQLRELDAIHASEKRKLQNRQQAAAVQKKIDAITKPKKSASGSMDFFAEAVNEEQLYGSNVGPRGTPLSGQDARGLLAEIALNTRRVEQHTGKVAKRRPRTAADDVSDASSHGY